MKKRLIRGLIVSLTIAVLYIIGVYCSGWEVQRSEELVMVYVFGLIATVGCGALAAFGDYVG